MRQMLYAGITLASLAAPVGAQDFAARADSVLKAAQSRGFSGVVRALAAIMRYPNRNTEVMPYLGIQLREIGRIAAVSGDRRTAARYYRHYLGMRAVAEPSARAQIDSVRRELAALD